MDLTTTFLWVSDVPAAAAFYRNAFGPAASALEENPGRGWRAEIPTGAGALSIADTAELAGPLGIADYVPLNGPAPVAVQLTFTTADVDAAHAAAVEHGATSLAPPTAMPWGQTIARVRAPHGVLISLATPTGGTR